jgi:hypothetical protein
MRVLPCKSGLLVITEMQVPLVISDVQVRLLVITDVQVPFPCQTSGLSNCSLLDNDDCLQENVPKTPKRQCQCRVANIDTEVCVQL